ncbi:MAG TPA: class I SAM-dependent methyltransferase [Rhodanobacteraceae bacterium]
MSSEERVLDFAAAQAYYDRFGKKQDSQGFYENPALDELIAHAGFEGSSRVFEFGCGTGKFAARLLGEHLPASADYLGCDVSPVMVGLAKGRLEAFGVRAQAVLADAAVRFPLSGHSVDRVVCSYVLDLLSEADIGRFLSEAHRVLMPGGRLCIASLTQGVSLPSRIIASLWMSVFRLRPALVGGCRPILVHAFVDPENWRIVHRRVLTPYGVPSEVLVLETKGMPNNGLE